MRLQRLCLLVVVLLAVASVHAQETDRKPHHPGVAATTDTPRFKFAIVTDRHGGRKPGTTVLEEAVAEINLLDPDFTLSVGDLINGYTDEPAKINAMWDEFDRDIRKLKRPFYYVFGNHDASNPVMLDLLKKRYGAPYYSFDHKGCHFIVLFTETRDAQGRLIELNGDAEQIAWLERDLAASTDAVHTFVFYHKPWASDKIMTLFKGRPTTVFTGHWHGYQQFTKDGINYHVLSTTGANLRPDFYNGGFYHYAVVTVSGTAVTTAVVRVGAVVPDDLLSLDRLSKIRTARQSLGQLFCKVPRGAATLADHPVAVTLPNPLPGPAKGDIVWTVPAGSPWTVTPAQSEVVLEPNADATLTFNVACTEDPFATSMSLLPRYRLRVLGGRALTAHSPRVAGLDPLYDVEGFLFPDAWPYTESVDAFRRSITAPAVRLNAWGAKADAFTVTNPFDDTLHVDFTWDVRNEQWTVTPQTLALDLPKGVPVPVRFVVPRVLADVYPLPRLHVKATLRGETVFDETRPLPVDATGCFSGVLRTGNVPLLKAKPTLDGKLDDAAWQDASTFDDFILDTGRAEPVRQTVVRVGSTPEGLWLAFRCDEPTKGRIRARVTDRDGAVWEDDSCEIFLDTNLDRKTYFQLIFNTLGVQYDGSTRDGSWNGTWEVKTAWEARAWTAEVFIPWETVGGRPVRGNQWGLNLARNRTVIRPGETGMWSPTLGSAHTPSRFGTVVFE